MLQLVEPVEPGESTDWQRQVCIATDPEQDQMTRDRSKRQRHTMTILYHDHLKPIRMKELYIDIYPFENFHFHSILQAFTMTFLENLENAKLINHFVLLQTNLLQSTTFAYRIHQI